LYVSLQFWLHNNNMAQCMEIGKYYGKHQSPSCQRPHIHGIRVGCWKRYWNNQQNNTSDEHCKWNNLYYLYYLYYYLYYLYYYYCWKIAPASRDNLVWPRTGRSRTLSAILKPVVLSSSSLGTSQTFNNMWVHTLVSQWSGCTPS
jgi:hypothetical protein